MRLEPMWKKRYIVKSITRPGETISSHRYESREGGKGANQAIAIARAGGRANFYGTVGHDGLWIKEKLAAFGLNVSGILVANVCFWFGVTYLFGCCSDVYSRFRRVEHSYNCLTREKIVLVSNATSFCVTKTSLLQFFFPVQITVGSWRKNGPIIAVPVTSFLEQPTFSCRMKFRWD